MVVLTVERRSVKLDLRLSVSERDAWVAAARREGISVSLLVRAAVTAYLGAGTQQGANGGLPAVVVAGVPIEHVRTMDVTFPNAVVEPVGVVSSAPDAAPLLARIPERAFKPDPRPVPVKKGRR